ncbi:uncharacterized protein JCM15063_004444 [Sporobolomyces koalae]|uniref:uncharacterized protein n=1 Tax=Sporobolomyces koalae TaxID=500713 RepID=UPI00316F27E3
MDSDTVSLSWDIVQYLVDTVLPTYLAPIPLTRALLSLCRVSRAMHHIAQPVLFHTPFISFDPPDTTPPGRTFERVEHLVHTLEHDRSGLATRVRNLGSLGQWSTRILSEGIPKNRIDVSTLLIRLVALCPNCETIAIPFVTISHQERFSRTIITNGSRLREIRFGEGYESQDPWVINFDPSVREQWGSAKFTIRDFQLWSNPLARVTHLKLMARLRVEDPLEEDDELVDSDEEPEVLGFKLEHFQLDLLRNSKLSFNYVYRLLYTSRTTLKSLVLKEHQLTSAPETLDRILETFGSTLTVLRTSSANQTTDNRHLLVTISTNCPNLETLSIGSRTSLALFEVLDLFANHLIHLRELGLENFYSLELYRRDHPNGRDDLVRVLLHGFQKLKRIVLTPQHANVTDARVQDETIGQPLRELDQTRDDSIAKTISTEINYWRWLVEISP